MATLKPELKALLDKYGIDSRDRAQVWDCHGTLVLYHKAYEIIAAKEAITFDPPTVIRCDKNDAVVLVVGKKGERAEWSFGEAVIGQNYKVSGNQAAYPWAMAEKRAKDRVVAKLAGLAQYVYSEDEADEFKEAKPQTAPQGDQRRFMDPPADTPAPQSAASLEEIRKRVESMQKVINATSSLSALAKVMENYGFNLKSGKADPGTSLHEIWQARPEGYDFLLNQAEKQRHFLANHPDDRKVA